jgi:hypothetical protein
MAHDEHPAAALEEDPHLGRVEDVDDEADPEAGVLDDLAEREALAHRVRAGRGEVGVGEVLVVVAGLGGGGLFGGAFGGSRGAARRRLLAGGRGGLGGGFHLGGLGAGGFGVGGGGGDRLRGGGCGEGAALHVTELAGARRGLHGLGGAVVVLAAAARALDTLGRLAVRG